MNAGTGNSMPAAVVRAANTHDLARVAEIYAHHVRTGTATFELEAPSIDEMTRRHAEVTRGGLPWLVAEAAGAVVGYAYATRFRPRPAYAYTVEDSVYLDPEWTGRGIGRALLHALIEACERAGLRQMVAVIGDSANAASVALHRSAGFIDAGVQRSVGYKFGRWLDTVMMQRTLGEGGSTKPAEPQADHRQP